jgi:GT2 family glycosyltransferase
MKKEKILALPYLFLLLPFDLVVVFTVLFMEIVALPLRLGKQRISSIQSRTPKSEFHNPTATIQILNWDGKQLLEECLPAVIEAIENEGGRHEILVVDNGSTDGSVAYVRDNFPQVRILALDRNYGFAEGNNRGVHHVKTDVVILLNSDMVVAGDFLHPLLDAFRDPSVFAVTSQVFLANAARREETGKTRARFESGFFYLWHDDIRPEDENHTTIPVFWAGGGSGAFDREKYLEIGGLDTLYYPFYVEDTDLSYQAWKRGWKCLLAPQSRVVHKHRGTSRPKFGDDFVDNTIRKNQFLFVWKNVTDLSMVLSHLINLPRIHARAIIRGRPGFEALAFIRAVRQLPEAMLQKVANMPSYVTRDSSVLKLTQ